MGPPKSKRSKVWNYFVLDSDSKKARCSQPGCTKSYMYVKGSTTSLKQHLAKHHKITFQEEPVPEEQPKPRVQKTIGQSFKAKPKDSLQTIVSKLASVDGFSLNKIVTSEFIGEAIEAKGFKMPKSVNTIKKHILAESKEKKEEVKLKFAEMLKQGVRFSLTLDEWTSIRNRRYVNINVHSKDEHWNLGLVRAIGSITADRTLELVRKKLQMFGLKFSFGVNGESRDIVCSTTDGASVMVSFGNKSDELHMQCYAHALHLAVQDTFYKSGNKSNEPDGEMNETSNGDDDEVLSNDEYDSDSNDSEDDDDECHDNVDENDSVNAMSPTLAPTIAKVRKVVKSIRRSPLKNDKLQEYIRQQHGKELVMICDNVTRWNSAVSMVKRFLQVKDSLDKVMIDFPSMKETFGEGEIKLLKEMVQALEPVKLAVDKLSSRSMNLLHADCIFKFLLKTLSETPGDLCRKLRTSIEKRLKERRPKKLMDAFNYLHNPESLKNKQEFEVFQMASKKDIRDTIKTLYVSLHDDNNPEENSEEEMVIEEGDTGGMEDDLERELRFVAQSAAIPSNLDTTINTDFKTWETSKVRSGRLELVYNSLATIQPTSVEAERAFSACALILTKIRSRMGDVLLDAITYLKAYYLGRGKTNIDTKDSNPSNIEGPSTSSNVVEIE